MTSPSLEGTLADSLIVWVWMDISLLVFKGLMRWMPSGRTSPVTRPKSVRSEEHTSELQSHSDLVCRLLLEKKNDKSFYSPLAALEAIEHRPHQLAREGTVC